MNAEDYLKSGVEYYEKGDYDRAITDTTEAIRLNPNLAFAYGTRGAAYKAKKDYDRAIVDLNEAIRLDPNNVPAYGNRGIVNLNKGDKKQAILDLEMVLKIQPENDEARQCLEKAKSRLEQDNTTIKKISKGGVNPVLIAAVICGVIGAMFGGISDGIPAGVAGAIVGAYLGVGIGLLRFKEDIVDFFAVAWDTTKERFNEEGFIQAIGQFFVGFFLGLIWLLIKLWFKIWLWPIVLLYRAITGT